MHTSVLVDEVIEYLRPAQGGVILDATVGCGGHTEKILEMIAPYGKLVGIDCDKNALGIAQERLSRFKGSFELIYDNFKNLDKVLAQLNIKKIDAALFDLGVSSLQLDDASRGFSFKNQAKLDMRMDNALTISAYDVVNTARESELDEILRDYGEERYYRKIARAIVESRKRQPITTTTQLAQVIYDVVPAKYKKYRIDPATRTFQALRIAVNNELGCLKIALEKLKDYLKPEGRLVIISFHSLEDRIAKRHFKEMAKENIYTILTKKPITAKEIERKENPRARSAKLRAVVKNV